MKSVSYYPKRVKMVSTRIRDNFDGFDGVGSRGRGCGGVRGEGERTRRRTEVASASGQATCVSTRRSAGRM